MEYVIILYRFESVIFKTENILGKWKAYNAYIEIEKKFTIDEGYRIELIEIDFKSREVVFSINEYGIVNVNGE